MNIKKFLIVSYISITAISAIAATIEKNTGPEAPNRTYGQNYKDMALGLCVSHSFEKNKEVEEDIGSSAGAMIEWTYYDMERAPEALEKLIKKYLARDYHDPIAESEHKGIKWNFLKCLDMYHSKELDAQVKQFVLKPNRTYRQEHLPKK